MATAITAEITKSVPVLAAIFERIYRASVASIQAKFIDQGTTTSTARPIARSAIAPDSESDSHSERHDMTAIDTSKLPKYVRDHILDLERRIDTLEGELRARNGDVGPTDTVKIGYGTDPDQLLAVGSTIGFGGNFLLEPNGSPAFRARLLRGHGNGSMGRAGDLEVSCDRTLSIVPQASNVVIIRLLGR